MNVKGLYQKRGWWYYQPPTKHGKRPPAIALKVQDEALAIDKVFELHKADALGAQSKDAMSVLVPRYLDEMNATKRHTGNSSHNSKKTLERVIKEWGDPPVAAITKERIIAWRLDLASREGYRGEKMSEASVTSYLRRLSGFLTWLVTNKHIRQHPMRDIHMPRVKKTRREKFCTVKQRDRLLEDDSAPENVRFILHFGFLAGLRFEEMLAMDESWIEVVGRKWLLTVKATKHWKPKDAEARTIEMHPRLVAFMRNHGIRRPFLLEPDKKVWKEAPNYRFNPKKAFKAFVKTHGLGWVSYHTLRHSLATHMAMAGAPMVEIAAVLGDSLRVTEETYVGYAPKTRGTITRI